MDKCTKLLYALVVAALFTGCARQRKVAVTSAQAGNGSTRKSAHSARPSSDQSSEFDYRPSSKLIKAQEEARRFGLPFKPADLNVPLPPPEQNAASDYKRMTALLKVRPLTAPDNIMDSVNGRRMPSAAQIKQIRNALAHRQDLIALVHQVASKPQCVFNRDYSLGPELTLPELVQMRHTARILTAESTLLLADGKPLEAIQNEALGFHTAWQTAQEPCIIACLVSVAIDASTLTWMEKCLYASENRPDILQAVQDAIEAHWKPHSAAYSLRGDVIMFLVLLDRLRQKGPDGVPDPDAVKDKNAKSMQSKGKIAEAQTAPSPWQRTALWDAMMDINEIDMLERMQQTLQAADLPYRKADAVLKTLDEKAQKNAENSFRFFSVALNSTYYDVETKRASAQAQAGVVRCAAALLLWKRQHGVFPERLDQAMDVPPTDPFDGKPLKYRRTGEGFVVYSVGANQTFMGGTRDKKPAKYQTYFWYPMPAYYTVNRLRSQAK
jgi:hypothetical protein